MVIRARTQTKLAILPPSPVVPGAFHNVEVDARRREDLLAQMQRLRGQIYVEDNAIHRSELTADGRHKLSIDEHSWHVLSLDGCGKVVACLRYVDESEASGFDDLWVRHAAMARCPQMGGKFRAAVETSMKRTRQMPMHFGEVGGWAVAEEHRWTAEPLRILLATYGMLELLGSCSGVATATFRHGSAKILRKIGLRALTVDGEELPPYHDPHYGCQMQALEFNSRTPNPKFREWIAELMQDLAMAPVICPATLATTLGRVWRGFEVPDPSPVAA